MENQEKKIYVELPSFTGRNVPIPEIAKAINKDIRFIRLGIQNGLLKFGVAQKVPGSHIFNYYCPDKKVWEETGYFNPCPKDEKKKNEH